MTDRETRLAELLDKQALTELVYRYARAVDRKDLDRLGRLYHRDAHHDHGGLFAGTPQEFVDWLKASMGDVETQHLIANALFVVEGDRARGEIYTVNFHHMPGQASNYIAGGRYLDDYVRHEGRWLFARRLRVIDWSEERPAQAGGTAALILRGKALPEDAAQALEPFFRD